MKNRERGVFVGDLQTYVWALVSQWASLFWAVTLVPDVLKLALRPAQQEGMARYFEGVKPETFFSVVRVLFVVGLFVAGFFAWDEEYQIATSKSPEALTAQITSLRNEIEPLKTYKEQHEAEEWPALTAAQERDWTALFLKYPAGASSVRIFVSDERSERFVDTLKAALAASHLLAPNVMPGPPIDCMTVTASPPSLANALGKLADELGCHALVYSDSVLPKGTPPFIQIMIGRKTHHNP